MFSIGAPIGTDNSSAQLEMCSTRYRALEHPLSQKKSEVFIINC